MDRRLQRLFHVLHNSLTLLQSEPGHNYNPLRNMFRHCSLAKSPPQVPDKDKRGTWHKYFFDSFSLARTSLSTNEINYGRADQTLVALCIFRTMRKNDLSSHGVCQGASYACAGDRHYQTIMKSFFTAFRASLTAGDSKLIWKVSHCAWNTKAHFSRCLVAGW